MYLPLRQRYWNLLRSKQKIQKNIYWRFRNPSRQSTAVFLVGCQRSGTNMVVRHLNRSPSIKLYNENNPAAFTDYHLHDFREISILVRKSFAPVVLFKPILDTYRLHHIAEQFPSAKFLYTFRHFNDVINSLIKAFGDDPAKRVKIWIENDLEPENRFRAKDSPHVSGVYDWVKYLSRDYDDVYSLTALYWYLQSNFLFDLGLENSKRIKLINYNSIVHRPGIIFSDICNFINAEFSPDIIKGIHAVSVSKNPPPNIPSEVKTKCDELWERILLSIHKSQ